MRARRAASGDLGVGLAGTIAVHALAGVFLVVGAAEARRPAPPTYKVHLVAAPEPTEETRKAPEAVERPAEEKPAPLPTAKRPPKSTVSPAAPPPVADNTKREAAPRTTPKAAPLPGETPSTGNDVATVSTEGVEFPFPEYLQNIVAQVLRAFDLEAQGAVEEAGRFKAFGRLPDGWSSDVLFVRFYFSGRRQ